MLSQVVIPQSISKSVITRCPASNKAIRFLMNEFYLPFTRKCRLIRRITFEFLFELPSGMARLAGGDFFRRALDHDRTAARTAFGTEVDDPVDGLDHVQIVLDHQH